MEKFPPSYSEHADFRSFLTCTDLHSLLFLFGGENGTATSRTLLEELKERAIKGGIHILRTMVQEGVMYEFRRERGGHVYALSPSGKEILKNLSRNGEAHLVPMAKPTNAQPGTAEKIRVLQERIRSGLPLWHPKDPHYTRIDPGDDLA